MKKYKELMNEGSDFMLDLFDEEIDSDNEKFLVTTGVDDGEATVTVERYDNPDDNDTEVVATAFYEIYDEEVLKDSGIEVSGWGKKNKTAIHNIINKEFDGAAFSNNREVENSLDIVVKKLSKIY